jgi:hypothetical protein
MLPDSLAEFHVEKLDQDGKTRLNNHVLTWPEHCTSRNAVGKMVQAVANAANSIHVGSVFRGWVSGNTRHFQRYDRFM